MLNKETLLYAIGQADSDFIEEARLAMGYGSGEYSGLSRKKLLRIALLAAMLAALLAVTAYAAGWFGLSARLTEPEETIVVYKDENEEVTVDGFISMNGYANSPEALAHAEWTAFCSEYRLSARFSNETDTSWTKTKDEENYYYIYGAFDRTMMDKLLEIQAKYNVRLHNQMSTPITNAHFYQASGAKPFLAEGMEFQCHYIFEDGSFKCEGSVQHDGQYVFFTIVRGARGVLDPSGNRMTNTESFYEWQHESTCGVTVNIATTEGSEVSGAGGYIFCEEGDYIVTVMFHVPAAEDMKAAAEEFADKIDYKALCTGDADLNHILDTAPRETKAKVGLLSIKDFAETPEYMASVEFWNAHRDYCDGLVENDVYVEGFDGYNYYGGFPTGIEELDREFEHLVEEYGLTAPTSSEVISYNLRVPAEMIYYSLNAFKSDPNGKYPEATEEEYFEAIGVEKFTSESRALSIVSYDNGAFIFEGFLGHGSYSLHYIPKGCFYPLFKGFHSTDVTSWAYESRCGEQVYISMGENPPYPKWGLRSILYETDTAYVVVTLDGGTGEAYRMEALADEIDFTVFK